MHCSTDSRGSLAPGTSSSFSIIVFVDIISLKDLGLNISYLKGQSPLFTKPSCPIIRLSRFFAVPLQTIHACFAVSIRKWLIEREQDKKGDHIHAEGHGRDVCHIKRTSGISDDACGHSSRRYYNVQDTNTKDAQVAKFIQGITGKVGNTKQQTDEITSLEELIPEEIQPSTRKQLIHIFAKTLSTGKILRIEDISNLVRRNAKSKDLNTN